MRPRCDPRAGLAAAGCVAREWGSTTPGLRWSALQGCTRLRCSDPEGQRQCLGGEAVGSWGGAGTGMTSIGPQAPEEYQDPLGTEPRTGLKQE